ncbi:hypothetical protein KY328_00995 [Candidatus Woesearchaeota archaeon]|nr:hypothetical protein [Candidatus Woesearchaeota archaeon]MBW3021473.1 hypothetical protein [Candidatus Woesearchaeota archaeon]
MDSSLLDWVRKARLDGYDESYIRKAMTKQGYDSKEISRALIQPKRGKGHHVFIAVIVVVILLSIAGLSYWFVIKPRMFYSGFIEEAYAGAEGQLFTAKELVRVELSKGFFARYHGKSLDDSDEIKCFIGSKSALCVQRSDWSGKEVKLYYDCDVYANTCEQLTIDYEHFEEKLAQVSGLDEEETFTIIAFEDQDALIFNCASNIETEDLIETGSRFGSEYNELSQTKIGVHIDSELKKVSRLPFDLRVNPKPVGYNEIKQDLEAGKTQMFVTDLVIMSVKFALGMTKTKIETEAAQYEWDSLKGKSDLVLYRSQLRALVEDLENEYLSNRETGVSMPRIYDDADFVGSSKIREQSLNIFNDLESELNDLANNYFHDEIQKLKEPVNESIESEIMRLRILQVLMFKGLISDNCIDSRSESGKSCQRDYAKRLGNFQLCEILIPEGLCEEAFT